MSEHKFFSLSFRALPRRFRIPAILLVMLASVVAASSPARSNYIDLIYDRQDGLEDVFKGFEFPPKEKLTKGFWGNEYNKKVARGDCPNAEYLLYESLKSNFPSAIKTTDKSKIASAWIYIALPQHYPEVLFCRVMQTVSKLRKQINAQKLPFDFFHQRRYYPTVEDYEDPRRRLRNQLKDLFTLALADYPSAQVALADFSNIGLYLRLTPAFAYVALARARASGYQENRLEYLYKQASDALSQKARAALAQVITSGDWPREWPVVRD
ncbi:MAG: hypothetical protein ACTSY1_02240 [Alphaproteobacteria bacterium]